MIALRCLSGDEDFAIQFAHFGGGAQVAAGDVADAAAAQLLRGSGICDVASRDLRAAAEMRELCREVFVIR